jgi:Protein of unknown function (DUF1631)
MSDTISPELLTPATDADGKLLLSTPEADALLRRCFEMIKTDVRLQVETSIEMTNDLFEANEFVKDDAVVIFRKMRGQWLERFDKAFLALFEKRMRGERRKGRRVDHDASIATLRVLNAFDQEHQAALTRGSFNLFRRTRSELNALDLRISILMRDPRPRESDNPFSPAYLLDAMGLTSRELFPDPRIWRPLLVRVIADTTSGINSAYIRLNRYLAGRGVLPEIKAELRARSELRPADDSELLPVFMRLIKEAGSAAADKLLALNIEVPAMAPSAETERAAAAFAKPLDPATATPARSSPSVPSAPSAPASPPSPSAHPFTPDAAPASTQAGVASASATDAPIPAVPMQAPASGLPPLAATTGAGPPPGPLVAGDVQSMRAAGLQPAPWPPSQNPYVLDLARGAMAAAPVSAPADGGFGLPQLDPMLALGSLASTVAALDRWQHTDPGMAISSGGAVAPGAEVTLLPLNRIPYIRAAIADQIVNSTDKITIDVIGLLFDYIFRDPSIPESLRNLFSRLQVPILKTALVDRSFFSDKKHPARRLLDHLALAAIGATGDAGYRAGFELVAAGVIDEVCRDFKVDFAVFDAADAKLQEFVDAEQSKAVAALDEEVAAALSVEEGEADRSHVRALIRDKLAGHALPFDIRSFSETAWADYLTSLRVQHGTQSAEWTGGVQTLDDLLWSITVKERTAQKARLAKMVPTLIRSLRAGGTAMQIGDDRMKPFLDAVFQLHMAAIKPEAAKTVPAKAEASKAEAAAQSAETAEVVEFNAAQKIENVHDFVTEMVLGTWIGFKRGETAVTARLSWISPLRSKYIFTSRARSRAIVLTPEELALRLGTGKATLLVEPVPLFDRAVSAALDSFGVQKVPEPTQAAA